LAYTSPAKILTRARTFRVLLASFAMAIDNNWSGAAFGCVADGCLFVMAVV